MNQERIDQIKKMFPPEHPSMLTDIIRELIAEVERLKQYEPSDEESPSNWGANSAASDQAYGISSNPVRRRTITGWMSDSDYEIFSQK